MTYIIAEPCVGVCDTACVEVCPVDCIHGPEDPKGVGAETKADGFDPDEKQLYIDPEECIDCGACEPECPVEAILRKVRFLRNGQNILRSTISFLGKNPSKESNQFINGCSLFGHPFFMFGNLLV